MPLNIKNSEVEALISEVVALTGESKTEAVRRALLERRAKLIQVAEPKAARLLHFLEEEVWPQVPKDILGKGVPQVEQDELLGFGPEGL